MYQLPNTKLLPSLYDRLFKDVISSGWCVKSDGHVESPQGFFALVEIPSDKGELTEMGNALEWFENEPVPPAGWYLTVENNQGIIWVYSLPSKEKAEAYFEALVEDYAKWEAE